MRSIGCETTQEDTHKKYKKVIHKYVRCIIKISTTYKESIKTTPYVLIFVVEVVLLLEVEVVQL